MVVVCYYMITKNVSALSAWNHFNISQAWMYFEDLVFVFSADFGGFQLILQPLKIQIPSFVPHGEIYSATVAKAFKEKN